LRDVVLAGLTLRIATQDRSERRLAQALEEIVWGAVFLNDDDNMLKWLIRRRALAPTLRGYRCQRGGQQGSRSQFHRSSPFNRDFHFGPGRRSAAYI
jgi:hypothetical protein